MSLAGLPAWLRACIDHEIESRRLVPWIAVAYGLGIVLAFAADGPLSLWPPVVVAFASAALAVRVRGRLSMLALAIAVSALFAGFAAAVARFQSVDAPVLQRLTISPLEGFVESVEQRSGGGGRLVVQVAKLDRVDEAARPPRVRVTTRSLAGIAPGDYVMARARLLPPPEAARPGGYDFARDAYFRGIGAVGSVSGKLVKTEPPIPPSISLRTAAAIDRARNGLTDRIASTIGGQAGAVSAALVTGKRGLIDERTNDVLRAAGIYHVVSISGLHMVLAAGVFFWLTRALLALSPALALHWPIKKIAALAGMAGATAYCIFSGSEVATERSLLMILVMQGAILFDRPALSFRNLAVSAILVLTREPEAVLGPSFQMSYAAVAGLIAFADAMNRLQPARETGDPLRRAALWATGAVVGTVGTTLIATIATGPFGTYHFQTLQPYGLIGNAATLPLISLVVMPAAVLGVLALPFGLDRPIWTAMGWASDAVLRLSEWVAGFAGSTVVVPAYGGAALGLLVLALLCATLFASGLRTLSAVPALLGLGLAAAPARPDVYIARDGSGAAVRGRDGRLTLVGRVPAFTADQWLKADGDPRKVGDATLKAASRCDRIGCTVAMADGRVLSHLVDRRGFETDCTRAAIVVSRLAAPKGCGAGTVVDRDYLAAHGATVLAASRDGFIATSVRRPGETRPWLARNERTAASPAYRVPPRARATSEEDQPTGPRPEPIPNPDEGLAPPEAPDGDPFQ